jgi:hypothetical protein
MYELLYEVGNITEEEGGDGLDMETAGVGEVGRTREPPVDNLSEETDGRLYREVGRR